jgi:hypothetical protein
VRLTVRAVRWWLWPLAMGLSLGPVAVPAVAQVPTGERAVAQARLELRSARAAYEAARSAFSVVESRFSAAIEEVNLARLSGDGARLDRAHAVAQDRSVPLRDQELRLEEAQRNLSAARSALVDVLSARLEQLVRQIDAAPSAQQRAQLDTLFRDLSAEIQSLEAEEGDAFRIDPVVLPGIAFDPRDGPEELRAKAEILERQAVVADSVIRSTERQIEALNTRLRLLRQGRDFLAGTDRFDDTRVPVVTGGPPGDRSTPTDSTVVGARPLTLEERIQAFRDYVVQLQSYRDQLLVRAEQFRRRVGAAA